jgi:hypothetical protein
VLPYSDAGIRGGMPDDEAARGVYDEGVGVEVLKPPAVIHPRWMSITGYAAGSIQPSKLGRDSNVIRGLSDGRIDFVKSFIAVMLLEIGALAQSPSSLQPDSKPIHQGIFTVSAKQGCVNQGNDRREFAPVVCWLQRHMSWKSDHEPHFALVGKPDGTNLGLAWPPYVVFNMSDGNDHWRMFRIGFRYDRTWRGYIFPTIAAKQIAHPLRY